MSTSNLRAEQQQRAEQFKAMHRGSLLLLPNAWDAMSARLIEDAGFDAIATTSAGVAWSLGYTDGEALPWEELLAATKRMTRVVRVPLTADIEGGFSRTPAELVRRTKEILGAGVAGINIEDGADNGHHALRPMADACERISTIRETATREGIPVVINARTDSYLLAFFGQPAVFEDVLARCRAYLEAGADCVFPIHLSDLQQITRLVAELNAPVNITGLPGGPSLPELQAAGVARVSTGTQPALHVAAAMTEAVAKLRDTGRLEHLSTSFNYPRMQKLFETRSV